MVSVMLWMAGGREVGTYMSTGSIAGRLGDKHNSMRKYLFAVITYDLSVGWLWLVRWLSIGSGNRT